MQYVYQSPKSKLRSTPVDEGDARRRGTLEAAGWKIVATINDKDPEAVAVQVADPVTEQKPEFPPLPEGAFALPEDVPCRDLLIDAGLDTLDLVKAALPSIHGVKGFGPARSAAVRAYFEPSPPEV